MKSKIIFFSIVAIAFSINIGCGDKFAEKLRDKHIIPYISIDTRIDMAIGGESNNWANQPKYFNVSSNGKSLGYEGHGIIIFTSDNIEFKCYDATCTNCTDLTAHFEQNNLNTWYATCPRCNTQYLLFDGTTTDKQKEIYPLKSYPITKSGNKLIVRN